MRPIRFCLLLLLSLICLLGFTPSWAQDNTTITFEEIDSTFILEGKEFEVLGVANITAITLDGYCHGTMSMVDAQDKTSGSYLTTGKYPTPGGCCCPLHFTFTEPVKSVSLRFSGCANSYKLTGFDDHGEAITFALAAPSSANAKTTIHIDVSHIEDTKGIHSIVFGRTGCMTAIYSMEVSK